MGIYLKKSGNGKVLTHFYGNYSLHGKRYTGIKLTEIRGTLPPNGLDSDPLLWDKEFRDSYYTASSELENIKNGVKNSPSEMEKARLYAQKNEIEIKLKNLANATTMSTLWEDYTQQVTFSCKIGTQKQCENYSRTFAKFIALRHNRDMKYPLYSVSMEDITAFLIHLDSDGYSQRSINAYIQQIKRLFRVLAPHSDVHLKANQIKTKPENNVNHQIFNRNEIHRIWAVAQKVNPLIHSMTIIAACTGLREKDIYFLRWSSVDFNAGNGHGMITLTTFKNKGAATLGMWAPLRQELEHLRKVSPVNAEFVFPEAADLIDKDTGEVNDQKWGIKSGNLLKQLRRVLMVVGFGDATETLTTLGTTENPNDLFEAIKYKIETSTRTPNWQQMALKIAGAYILNEYSMDIISQEFHISKPLISWYIRGIKEVTGQDIVRRRTRLTEKIDPSQVRPFKGESDPHRKKKPCLLGWHSFRGSFVTLALKAGVSIELLKKIMGSHTVDIIIRHYVQPDESFIHEGFTAKDPFSQGIISSL